MATYSQTIRKGLPRSPGGPAWPDVEGAVIAQAVTSTPGAAEPAEVAAPAVADSASVVDVAAAAAASVAESTVTETSVAETPQPEPQVEAIAEPQTAVPSSPDVKRVTAEVSLRQGLPRVPGGEPWPPAANVTVARAAATATAGVAAVGAPSAGGGATDTHVDAAKAPKHAAAETVAADEAVSVLPAAAAAKAQPANAFDSVTEELTLRQGLPRVPGGEAWPAAGTVEVQRAIATAVPATAAASPAEISAAAHMPAATAATAAETETVAEAALAEASAASAPAPASPTAVATPAPVAPAAATSAAAASAATVAAAPAASTAAPAVKQPKPKREPIVIGSRTLGKWVGLAVLWGGGAILAAAIIVLAARGLTTLPGVPEFMKRYPGEYHLPEFVDPGFPAWARWSHFLNFFLMVLIIRSGLLVRRQQKPDAFFTPKKGGKKISIYLWLHTSIDILWLLNGVVFVVLLFISGHWARIVPTSWEVFPNALSAGIQYLTLEWPVEDGWVNYNSLQQLMYFTVVFIAAPLAAITGVRMSEWWPEKVEKLNKLYPAPIARAVHYPTMLFFVLFILIHVFLVFTTGALKNLNHMFAGTPEISWVGFWWFAAGLLVTAAVTWAARPLVLAPIANLFGRVSER